MGRKSLGVMLTNLRIAFNGSQLQGDSGRGGGCIERGGGVTLAGSAGAGLIIVVWW